MDIWLLLIGLLLVAAITYWLLVSTEGVFLGRRVVIWLYDLTAHRYDHIKEYDPEAERILVTNPILELTARKPHALILDVATGTGRVPFDLMQSENFKGRLIGLDASRTMLALAAAKLAPYGRRVSLTRGRAGFLPFPNERFDVVTCLEALEFFPSDEAALREMFRVLRPGGRLVASRRCGREGKMFLHRHRSEEAFVGLLHELHLRDVRTFLWEEGYDLVIARKALAPAISSYDAVSVEDEYEPGS